MLFKLKSRHAFATLGGPFLLVVQVVAAPPKVGDILFYNTPGVILPTDVANSQARRFLTLKSGLRRMLFLCHVRT